MTKKQLKGEIYEIQGILYIIASYFVHTPWIATVVFFWGVITIVVGGTYQISKRNKNDSD
jgi:formate hydrogenlyase subunit 3/multisubunit Na+/H+ antiporter MnhD subunit